MSYYIDCECQYRTPLPDHVDDSYTPHCDRCNNTGSVRIPDPHLNLTADADNTERAEARQFAHIALHMGRGYISQLDWDDLRESIRHKLRPTHDLC